MTKLDQMRLKQTKQPARINAEVFLAPTQMRASSTHPTETSAGCARNAPLTVAHST